MKFDLVECVNSEQKGKPSCSIACMEKIAASVLLNLFISGNEKCTQLTRDSA